jgi:hypothetical protein
MAREASGFRAGETKPRTAVFRSDRAPRLRGPPEKMGGALQPPLASGVRGKRMGERQRAASMIKRRGVCDEEQNFGRSPALQGG